MRAHVFASPIMSNGICTGTPWHRCCSMTPGVLPRGQGDSALSAHRAIQLAKAKKATKRSVNGLRVMGFAGLMTHLGTLTHAPCACRFASRIGSRCMPSQRSSGGRIQAVNIQPTRVQ